jgi:hydroxymethylglutaryl-CoA reductase
MALHARNIALSAGAKGEEVNWLVTQMVEARDVRSDKAAELLKQKRAQ